MTPRKPGMERVAGAQRQLDDARRVLAALSESLEHLPHLCLDPPWTVGERAELEAVYVAVRAAASRLRTVPSWLPRLPLGANDPQPGADHGPSRT